jgi:hypothetical protein
LVGIELELLTSNDVPLKISIKNWLEHPNITQLSMLKNKDKKDDKNYVKKYIEYMYDMCKIIDSDDEIISREQELN